MSKKGGGGSQTVTQQLDPMLKPFIQYALGQAIGQYQRRTGLPVVGGMAAGPGIPAIPPVSPSAAAGIGANAAGTIPPARRRRGGEEGQRGPGVGGYSRSSPNPGDIAGGGYGNGNVGSSRDKGFLGLFADGGILALKKGGEAAVDYGTIIPAGPSGYQKYTGDLVAGFTPDTQD